MEELEIEQSATHASDEEVIDAIITIPNVISFVRLCLAPVFLALLLSNHNVSAALLFAFAAGTDFVDGLVARSTHTVSRIGQLLDPAVDRILMLSAVLGLLICGRLPLWITLLVFARDALLLIGGGYLLKRHGIRVPVVYSGKVATTLLFVGCAGLLLNMPQIAGLGWCDFSWLPGFNGESCSWGIWFVYAGFLLGCCTTTYYVAQAVKKLREVRGKEVAHGGE